MIAKTRGIKLHCIQDINLYVTVEFCKIRSTLAEISSMQKKNILLAINYPDTVNICSLFNRSTMSCKLTSPFGIDMTMSVIQMQNRQILSKCN